LLDPTRPDKIQSYGVIEAEGAALPPDGPIVLRQLHIRHLLRGMAWQVVTGRFEGRHCISFDPKAAQCGGWWGLSPWAAQCGDWLGLRGLGFQGVNPRVAG
jgi:hypothetical protein